MQRLTNLEQGNHAEAIEESVQENAINDVKNQLPKFLPKAVSDYVKPLLERMVLDVMKKNPINLFKSSSTPADTLSEYELKHKLYDMMQKSRSFLTHDKHLELYNALMNSMAVDESAAKGREGEKMLVGLRPKSKAQEEYPHYKKGDDAKEPRQEEGLEHEVQFELIDAEEEPEENKIINGSIILFGK
ncbi:hypothetical protein Tco_1292094, partial [Tanacetum coccineum]